MSLKHDLVSVWICIKCYIVSKRYPIFKYQHKLVDKVSNLLSNYDPVGLMGHGCPGDEYDPEARILVEEYLGVATSELEWAIVLCWTLDEQFTGGRMPSYNGKPEIIFPVKYGTYKPENYLDIARQLHLLLSNFDLKDLEQ